MTTTGRLLFRVEKVTITGDMFIDFLKKLMKHRHQNRKLIVITDRAPPHSPESEGIYGSK